MNRDTTIALLKQAFINVQRAICDLDAIDHAARLKSDPRAYLQRIQRGLESAAFQLEDLQTEIRCNRE
jgi:hypothetical protein